MDASASNRERRPVAQRERSLVLATAPKQKIAPEPPRCPTLMLAPYPAKPVSYARLIPFCRSILYGTP